MIILRKIYFFVGHFICFFFSCSISLSASFKLLLRSLNFYPFLLLATQRSLKNCDYKSVFFFFLFWKKNLMIIDFWGIHDGNKVLLTEQHIIYPPDECSSFLCFIRKYIQVYLCASRFFPFNAHKL